MKESNTVANIAAMKQLQRDILLVTRKQHMKESNMVVNIAAMKQLQRTFLHVTRGQCIKESIKIANIVAMKHLQRDHLPDTIRLSMTPWLYFLFLHWYHVSCIISMPL